jgi:hypothetical protein
MQKSLSSLCLIVAYAGICNAQNQGLSERQRRDLLVEIDASVGILKAGRTGDRFFVPYLRERMQDAINAQDEAAADAVHMALAKLGEAKEQQEAYCRIHSNKKSEITKGLYEAAYVGGWFSIQTLAEAMDADRRFTNAKPKETGDLVVAMPSMESLRLLPSLVPDPPVVIDLASFDSRTIPEKTAVWKKWITDNHSTLSKLVPTGESVVMHPSACRNGRPKRALAK